MLRAGATSVRITGRSGLGVVDEEFQDSLFIRTDMLPVGFQFFSFGTFFSGHPSTFTSDAFPSVAALNGMSGEFDLEADVIGHIRGCEDCPSVALFGPAQITAAPAPVPNPRRSSCSQPVRLQWEGECGSADRERARPARTPADLQAGAGCRFHLTAEGYVRLLMTVASRRFVSSILLAGAQMSSG